MKKKFLNFSALAIILLVVSCSSTDDTDDTTDPIPTVITGNYFPNTIGDTWTYAVEGASTTDPNLNFSETDVVTISSSNTNTFTFEINGGNAIVYGTMNSILNSGSLTKTESTLTFSGEIPLIADIDILPTTSIGLTNFLAYDLNAEINTQIALATGSFTDTIDFGTLTAPVTTEYTVNNTYKGTLSSLTVNGETYTNVVHTEIKVNITSTGTIGIPVTIIEPQTVLTLNNYYVKNIGLIKSEAQQGFTLSQTIISVLESQGGSVDFPTSGSSTNTQELTNYTVN